jgi:general secretion pathway protein F
MMRFQFQALQPDGQVVSGQLEADSPRGAYRELRRRGVQPSSIVTAVGQHRANRVRRKARTSDYTYILKELHALIRGGVPIAEAVGALAEASAHPTLARACGELNAGLGRGEKFSLAFARCFPGFPSYINRIVEAGEMTGRLGEALADAAAEMEHQARIRSELRNALVYPAFLVGAGVLAVVFIFLVVVPRFAVMFHGKFDALPLLSYLVIVGGLWLRGHLLTAGLLVLLAGFAAAYAWRNETWRARALDTLYRMPLLRNWFVDVETARWAAVLARLLENRVPLMQSLELARTALRSPDIRLRLGQVERGVRSGGALAAGLQDHRFLPPTALSLIRVGERSGTLAEMVRSVTEIYEEIVSNRIKAVLSILEPVAIVIIGAVVGLVAVAIFLAITAVNKLPTL